MSRDLFQAAQRGTLARVADRRLARSFTDKVGNELRITLDEFRGVRLGAEKSAEDRTGAEEEFARGRDRQLQHACIHGLQLAARDPFAHQLFELVDGVPEQFENGLPVGAVATVNGIDDQAVVMRIIAKYLQIDLDALVQAFAHRAFHGDERGEAAPQLLGDLGGSLDEQVGQLPKVVADQRGVDAGDLRHLVERYLARRLALERLPDGRDQRGLSDGALRRRPPLAASGLRFFGCSCHARYRQLRIECHRVRRNIASAPQLGKLVAGIARSLDRHPVCGGRYSDTKE